jgi:cell division protein ZapA
MSKASLPVTVTIMGKEYKIACEEEERDNLIRSATQLDEQMRKMRDSGKVAGPDRIAVMTALNLAHELQVLKNQNVMLSQSLSECLTNMLHKIENVLENP